MLLIKSELVDPSTLFSENGSCTPTKIQKEAWPAIADGRHVLVSAPTGTGKTLSAFLVFIDQLGGLAGRGELKDELYVIYVSPLKSLAGDIRENLRKPLEGIEAEALEENRFRPESEEPGEGTPGGGPGKQSIGQIQAAIRTGDTPQKERQRMVKHPPHILIITPESLYLMLTSKSGRQVLKTARAIILDELHALRPRVRAHPVGRPYLYGQGTGFPGRLF